MLSVQSDYDVESASVGDEPISVDIYDPVNWDTLKVFMNIAVRYT